MIMIRTLT